MSCLPVDDETNITIIHCQTYLFYDRAVPNLPVTHELLLASSPRLRRHIAHVDRSTSPASSSSFATNFAFLRLSELRFTSASERKNQTTVRQLKITRNSSGDEIANVNFLYDDIVHALKIQ